MLIWARRRTAFEGVLLPSLDSVMELQYSSADGAIRRQQRVGLEPSSVRSKQSSFGLATNRSCRAQNVKAGLNLITKELADLFIVEVVEEIAESTCTEQCAEGAEETIGGGRERPLHLDHVADGASLGHRICNIQTGSRISRVESLRFGTVLRILQAGRGR